MSLFFQYHLFLSKLFGLGYDWYAWPSDCLGLYTPLLIFMHDVINLTQIEAIGARPPPLAPLSSFWVRILHFIGMYNKSVANVWHDLKIATILTPYWISEIAAGDFFFWGGPMVCHSRHTPGPILKHQLFMSYFQVKANALGLLMTTVLLNHSFLQSDVGGCGTFVTCKGEIIFKPKWMGLFTWKLFKGIKVVSYSH